MRASPMAIETYVSAGADREELIRSRDAAVPLGQRQGTAWDIANAALYLASPAAAWVTGKLLSVDGKSEENLIPSPLPDL